MGLVSPQIHLKHDEFFKTVIYNSGNGHNVSGWQYLPSIRQMSRPRRVQLDKISDTEESNTNLTYPNKQGMEQ